MPQKGTPTVFLVSSVERGSLSLVRALSLFGQQEQNTTVVKTTK
jgi:hypothetical protein